MRRHPFGYGADFDPMAILKAAGGAAATQFLNIPVVKEAVASEAEKTAYAKAAEELQALRISATETVTKYKSYFIFGGLALAGLTAYLFLRKKK